MPLTVHGKHGTDRLRPVLLQAYRLAVVLLIVLIIRQQHQLIRVNGRAPIRLDEVRAFLPNARSLAVDHSPRQGMQVLDGAGNIIGHALRSSRYTDGIVGYSGSTDTLIVLDAADQIQGVSIRSSMDTPEHVRDIVADGQFLKTWDGLAGQKASAMDLKAAGVEGVSGATLTSMAIAQGVVHRMKVIENASTATHDFHWQWRDTALAGVIVAAGLLAFTSLRSKPWLRRGFQVLVVGYLGLTSGDLLAQALVLGWAAAGTVPWRLAPGVVLLVAASLLTPWSTRRQVYCAQLCPYGVLQEWAGSLGQRLGIQISLRADIKRPLRLLPPMLLATMLLAVMLNLPVNLASLEPFDAFLRRGWGTATTILAIAGMFAALLFPQAYCKFGCPTGAMLDWVRSHGSADHFSGRDAAGGIVALVLLLIHWQHEPLQRIMLGG